MQAWHSKLSFNYVSIKILEYKVVAVKAL